MRRAPVTERPKSQTCWKRSRRHGKELGFFGVRMLNPLLPKQRTPGRHRDVVDREDRLREVTCPLKVSAPYVHTSPTRGSYGLIERVREGTGIPLKPTPMTPSMVVHFSRIAQPWDRHVCAFLENWLPMTPSTYVHFSGIAQPWDRHVCAFLGNCTCIGSRI